MESCDRLKGLQAAKGGFAGKTGGRYTYQQIGGCQAGEWSGPSK